MKNIIKFNQTDTVYRILTENTSGVAKTFNWYVNDTLIFKTYIAPCARFINDYCDIVVNKGDTLWSNKPFSIQILTNMRRSIPCNPEKCNAKLCDIYLATMS